MERIWQKNYPQGVPFEIDSSAYNSIPELISDTCKKFKDKTSFINMGSELSFSELDELSSDFASFLQQKGLQKGDRIALQMPNLLQYPIALFGALKAGLVIVNINPLYTPREMKHHLSNSGAKAIVILSNFAHHLETVIANTNIKTVIVTQLGDQLGWPKSLLINFAVKHIKKMVPKYELPEAYSFYEALDIGAERHYTPATIDAEDVAFLQYT